MSTPITRRGLLAGTALFPAMSLQAASRPTFRFCLNSSTIRDNGKQRPLIDLIEIAARAGYGGLEPWIAEIDAHLRSGHTLKDARKKMADSGLVMPSAIGFAEWIVDDDARRRKGLDQAKREMAWVAELGGEKIAAPPVGASKPEDVRNPVDLLKAADRYRELLEAGRSLGVTPQVEVWGFSSTLSRLGEAWLVASECGAAGGCILPDIYHLYKGGSNFHGLKLLAPQSIGIFHVNDYPKIERGRIVDADRVYPGDGIAPLTEIFQTLQAIGYQGFLSIELFNREYWKQDPHQVARTALEKLQALIPR